MRVRLEQNFMLLKMGLGMPGRLAPSKNRGRNQINHPYQKQTQKSEKMTISSQARSLG